MEPKKEPKRDPKRVPKGGPGEDPEKGDLISSISMPVSNGMLTFGTCLSKEREARFYLRNVSTRGNETKQEKARKTRESATMLGNH